MTAAASLNTYIGNQALSNSFANGVEVATATSGYVPLIPVGTIAQFIDPYWGGVEAIRLSIPTSTAVRVGAISTLQADNSYNAVPNTANLGQSLAFSLSDVPSNAAYVQYAWFQIAGRGPVLSGASVAANTAFGITAAGTAGANAAGKQILNARVQIAATTTVVKANTQTQNGSSFLRVTNSDGWFVGMALSGTGIPASTVVGSISVDGTVVGMVQTGTTTAQNATATGSTSVTGTYNDGTRYWNVATFNRPFAQGAIT
ncbi:MAG: hypothetical protein J0H69_16945 [Burkholderiales bacterium]|nr:hypothetical protein [Burkholderiales bacterium]